ncbi:hypothetical protein NliqN6_0191 [Naganishia liquefaciens]|uniref:Uncharacterized protein n=1 Tax=Naganishia liquefaciens TaxID=104408 RepID=A0A8H3TMX7_9TREE|nr:hypothetical protein NliqN6_0191 [Naganishia liquefaciens]
MRHPHPASYNVLWASRNGAVGGAILGVPLMALTAILDTVMENSSSSIASLASIIQYALGVGISAGSASLGARILIASLGAERVRQGVKESAIAGAVGSAVWIGASLVVSLVILTITSGGGGIARTIQKFQLKRRNDRAGNVVAVERVESGADGPSIERNGVWRV